MLRLVPFTSEHLPLFYEWAKKEHVKNTWFLEGYISVEQIASFVTPNGKAGFQRVETKPDGVTTCLVMELKRPGNTFSCI